MIKNYDKNKIKYIDFLASFYASSDKLYLIKLKKLFCDKKFDIIIPHFKENYKNLKIKHIKESLFLTAFSQFLKEGTIHKQYCNYFCKNLKFDTSNDFLGAFVAYKQKKEDELLVFQHLTYFKNLYLQNLNQCAPVRGIVLEDNFIIFDGMHRASLYYMNENASLNFLPL